MHLCFSIPLNSFFLDVEPSLQAKRERERDTERERDRERERIFGN